MPKFIVTHGSLLLGGKTVAAGVPFDATDAQLDGVPNVLPFIEGEQSLAAFAEEGGKPSAWHAALLTRRAKKAAAKPVEPPKGK